MVNLYLPLSVSYQYNETCGELCRTMERGVIGHVVQIGKIGVRQKVAIREKRATPAEVILWKEIQNRNPGGLKFRRQYPVLGFILDFYCVEKSLGIEYHKQKIFPSQSLLSSQDLW